MISATEIIPQSRFFQIRETYSLNFNSLAVNPFQSAIVVCLNVNDTHCWFGDSHFITRFMFQLRCTVRECQQLLEQRERELVCHAGHCFDQAKQGYWNLLQPQDKKSKNPGDSEDAVLARHRWLQYGHAKSLIETLRPLVRYQRSGGKLKNT